MAESAAIREREVDATVMAELRGCVLFRDLANHELARVAPLLDERAVAPGDFIVREGEPAAELFIVRRGSVEVVKHAAGAATDHRLTTLAAGDTFGEMALVDRAPRSASVRALEPTTVAGLHMDALDAATLPDPALRARMLHNLTVFLARRLRDVSEVTVTALDRELELARVRVAMGRFLVLVTMMMVVYGFALRVVADLTRAVADTSMISIPMILGFTIPLWIMVRRSGEPRALYGLTWRGAGPAARDAVLWSLPILALATLLKLALVRNVASLAGIPVFRFGGWLDPSATAADVQLAVVMSLGYIVIVPLQEFVARGALQGPLQRFLVGPRATITAVVVANFLFVASHLYLSPTFALIAMIPGLLWGALYARHPTLVAPVLSHILIGWWSLFVLGFDRLLV